MIPNTRKIFLLATAASALFQGGCAYLPFRHQAAEELKAPPPTETIVEDRATIDPAWLRSPDSPFTLGPGDILEIYVVGEPGSQTLTPVGPDGKVYFHVLNGVDVWGLTPSEAARELENSMSQLYRSPPRVTVNLREVHSKQVWLLGRFADPGIYPLAAPTTLLEAISLAGGPAPTPVYALLGNGGAATFAGGTDEAADLTRAFLIRNGELLPVNFNRLVREGDMSQNIYLEPDDLIYFPSAVSDEIHILGAVESPRSVALTRQTTLLVAIAAAGGPVREAHKAQVAIVRGDLNNPRIIMVNYNDIISGKANDIMLEPHDIVYVPLKPYRILTRYLDLILNTFARTVGVNAGARAVSRDQSVSIGIGP